MRFLYRHGEKNSVCDGYWVQQQKLVFCTATSVQFLYFFQVLATSQQCYVNCKDSGHLYPKMSLAHTVPYHCNSLWDISDVLEIVYQEKNSMNTHHLACGSPCFIKVFLLVTAWQYTMPNGKNGFYSSFLDSLTIHLWPHNKYSQFGSCLKSFTMWEISFQLISQFLASVRLLANPLSKLQFTRKSFEAFS